MLNLIGLLISFVIIIIMLRKKINFGFSLITGSLVMIIFSSFEIEISEMAKSLLESLIYSIDKQTFQLTTIKLAVVVLLIVVVAKSMELTGMLEKLIGAFSKVFSSKALLAILPAVIGLLHVPGGALFSAPMVGTEGKKVGASREEISVYNVWFRHIWFLISPFSSSIILICSESFANMNIYTFIFYQLPVFFFMVFLGLIMMRGIPKNKKRKERKTSLREMKYVLPIVAPIVISLILSTVFGLDSIISLIISLPVGIILIFVIGKIGFRESVDIVVRSLSWKMPLAVIGIMMFRAAVISSGVIESIRSLIESYSIPPLVAIVIIPFILSFLMGHNLGSIALAYPLLQPLFDITGYSKVALTSILYVSSFSSYLFSPLHLCVVVTNEYLKPDPSKFYRIIVPYSVMLIPFNIFVMLGLVR